MAHNENAVQKLNINEVNCAALSSTASNNNITIEEGVDFVLGTSTGFSIGTAGAQKLGFHGATPIVQQTGVAVSAAGVHAALVNLGLITA